MSDGHQILSEHVVAHMDTLDPILEDGFEIAAVVTVVELVSPSSVQVRARSSVTVPHALGLLEQAKHSCLMPPIE